MTMLPRILLIFVAILIINIPFGYWRVNTRRFSWQWILAIHVPVPIAIGLRLAFLGWNWALIPLFVAAFSIGQFTGGRLRRRLTNKGAELSSNLASDLIRVMRAKELSSNPG